MANRTYCTVADIKSYLTIGQDIDDVLLENVIERATKMIETYTHRVFQCDSATSRFFDAEQDTSQKRRRLWLRYDCAEISYVKNGDGSTILATNYVTLPRNETPIYAIDLKLSYDDVFFWDESPEDAIEVSAFWAYSKTPPLDIVQACVRLSTFLYKQKDTTSDIERPILTGDGSTIMPVRLPKDVEQILKPYIAEVL